MGEDSRPHSDVRNPGPLGAGREHHDALLEVMQQHADATRKSQRLPGPEERGRGRVVVLILLVLAFVALLWQGDSWLGPKPPPAETPRQVENALRLGMYLQAERIKAYRIHTGQLPDKLDDAGPPVPGIRYHKLDDGTYEINGRNGPVTLTYRSDQPAVRLIGDAINQIGIQ
jgi:hypothetical protein